MKKRFTFFGLALACATGLRADVTIRYQSEVKTAPALQPLMAPLMKAAQGGSAGTAIRMADALHPMFEEIFKNQSVILRTHMEMYMPFLATMAKQMAGQGQTPASIDPDAPLMEMNQEVAELSSASVDASLFEIPKDYAAAPADDLIRDTIKASSAGALSRKP